MNKFVSKYGHVQGDMPINSNTELTSVVIDIGSSEIYSGFSGDDQPRVSTPPIVGRTKKLKGFSEMNYKTIYVGNENYMKGRRKMTYPISVNPHKKFEDWENLDIILDYIFRNELRIETEETQMFFTDLPNLTEDGYGKFSELMFEKYSTPAMYLCNQSVAAAYESGALNGVVVYLGHGMSEIVPVYGGWPILHGVIRLEHSSYDLRLSGKLLTDRLQKLLKKRGIDLSTSSQREIVKDIKEKLCKVRIGDEKDDVSMVYELPDGSRVEIGRERYDTPEILFNPSLGGFDDVGSLQENILRAIKRCDKDLSKILAENIVIVGGSTMFLGFNKRLQRELEDLTKYSHGIKVISRPERRIAPWIGGSVITSLASMTSKKWFTRKDYEEIGAMSIRKKCRTSVPVIFHRKISVDMDLFGRMRYVVDTSNCGFHVKLNNTEIKLCIELLKLL